MATHVPPIITNPGGGTGAGDDRATSAYRWAWWAVGCYPLAFVAAFVIGEGLYTLLGGDDSPPPWAAPLAAAPAIAVFALPGLAAVVLGRRAMRLGRRDGRTPAIVGAAIAVSFVAMNLLSYLAQLVAG